MLQSMGSQESDPTWQLNNNRDLREVSSLPRALDASFEKDRVCTKGLRVFSSFFFATRRSAKGFHLNRAFIYLKSIHGILFQTLCWTMER